MSTLKVDTILKRTGTGTITLGQSGDTISIPSGATISNSGTASGFGLTEIETPYAARISKPDNQSISNDTWTLLDFASGNNDISKGSISDLATAKITIPSGADGLWWFHVNLRVNNFRANRNAVQLYKNGSATTGGIGDMFEMGYWGASSQYSSVGGAVLMNLSAGDYIQPYFKQNSGGSDFIIDRSFTAWYLGSAT